MCTSEEMLFDISSPIWFHANEKEKKNKKKKKKVKKIKNLNFEKQKQMLWRYGG